MNKRKLHYNYKAVDFLVLQGDGKKRINKCYLADIPQHDFHESVFLQRIVELPGWARWFSRFGFKRQSGSTPAFQQWQEAQKEPPERKRCSLETWQNRKINLTFLSLDKLSKYHLHVKGSFKMSTEKCRLHTTNNASLTDAQDEITIHELWGNWEKRADTDTAFILKLVLFHTISLLFLLWELFYVFHNWQRDLSSFPLLLPLWSSAGWLILIFFNIEIMTESPCTVEVRL